MDVSSCLTLVILCLVVDRQIITRISLRETFLLVLCSVFVISSPSIFFYIQPTRAVFSFPKQFISPAASKHTRIPLHSTSTPDELHYPNQSSGFLQPPHRDPPVIITVNGGHQQSHQTHTDLNQPIELLTASAETHSRSRHITARSRLSGG